MRKKLPWLLLVIVVIVSAIIIALLVKDREKEESALPVSTEASGPRLEIDANAGDLVETETEAPPPGISIPGWGSITLPAGVTEANVSLKNPEENEGWYYLTFELQLKDTGEVIFTTGLIPPGQYCNKVTLTRELEAGEYEAIMHVQPYKMDEDQTPTNNADMETILVVNE